MALIPWEPFRDFDKWVENWDFFPIMPLRGYRVPTDITQDKDNVYVEMELPGVKSENVELEVENNILFIKASQEEKKEESELKQPSIFDF